MRGAPDSLQEFLLDTGAISRAQLAQARERAQQTGEPLPAALVAQGVLSEDEARRAVAHQLGIPYVVLSRDSIAPDTLPFIPEPLARARGMVAFRLSEEGLEVALLDIADLPALEALPVSRHYRVLPRLTDRESLKRALLLYQRQLKEQFGDVIGSEAAAISTPAENSPEGLRYAAERVAVEHVVDALLGHALYQQAGAVHLDATDGGLLVRYRIGNDLHEAMLLPAHAAESVAANLKLRAGLSLESPLPQEGRFKMDVAGARARVAVAAMPTITGERVVLHLTAQSDRRKGFTLESLGFHGEGLEQLRAALLRRSGLLLVCGPAGSGKSTLLYTLLDMVSTPAHSIATIEETIGHRLAHGTQTQLNPELGITYAAGLRALLRQDPDVVMVEAIADSETAALALAAANRGKLVLAGVEAPSAAAGVEQLLALGVSPELLAACLRGAVGLSLAGRLCVERDAHKLSRAESDVLEAGADFGRVLAALKEEGLLAAHTAWKDLLFFRPQPCQRCSDGYRGFIGLQEVHIPSLAYRAALSGGADAAALAQTARADGALNLLEDGIYKMARGFTSVQAVLRTAEE